MRSRIVSIISLILFAAVCFSGCSSSSNTEEESNETSEEEILTKPEIKNYESAAILNIAEAEQENEMYSPDVDSTYLYWLDNELIVLNGSTKCNIFALNVLYKSGFKTPDENALAADLFDTANYKQILPVVGINDVSDARKGDLIIWKSHVIIYESYTNINEQDFAIGWWAGTRQQDNDDNIRNNVCYGKYKLDGEFVVRRPLKNDS